VIEVGKNGAPPEKKWVCGQCDPRVYFAKEADIVGHMERLHPEMKRRGLCWFGPECFAMEAL
jgi:hypothetical protein